MFVMFYVSTSQLVQVINFISHIQFWMLQPHSNLNASLKNSAIDVVAHVFCFLFTVYWAWYFFVLYLCLPISALILWRIFLNTFQQVSTVWHFHFNSICFYIEHATAHTGLLIGDRQRLSLIMELPIYCYTALVLETGCKLVTWLQPR